MPSSLSNELLSLLRRVERPLSLQEIAQGLVDLQGPPSAPSLEPSAPVSSFELREALDELASRGLLSRSSGPKFQAVDAAPIVRATDLEGVLSVNPRGFGFVAVPGLPDDLFIPAECMLGALHGDVVRVRRRSRSRRGSEGEVVAIVRRRQTRVAGLLRRRGRSAWLEPDDTRVRGPIVLPVVEGQASQGSDGQAAVVELTRYPEHPDENPEGRIVAILGAPGDPKVEVAKILIREGIEEQHPPQAVADAEAYGEEVDVSALVGREDLTHLPLPTIDPEDARDHDDAVWAVRTDAGGYRVWMAIADVSHYVRPGTALDDAALARGNSIYFPDRAIPMLPRALSSNLCSLLPGVIRLCLCVEVELDAAATVLGSRVVQGFMRSVAKLTYPSVARALGFTDEPPRDPVAESMRDDLQVLAEVSRLLRARRMSRGALDFELPEAKVVLDLVTGAPVAVQKRAQDAGVKKAYQLIEELMLLANEQVAAFLVAKNIPGIYRNHARPDPTKLERFAVFCEELGLDFDPEDAGDPKSLSTFLRRIAAHPRRDVLDMLLLRAMKQAVYEVDNIGHFGLASEAYLHFTSPIRRYPDLVVHRAVKRVLAGERVDRSEEGVERLRLAAATACATERKAMEIEREVVDLYRALYMRSRLGDVFDARVTAIVSAGLFVAVPDPFVDVLVRFESLGPDGYAADEQGLRVVGTRSGERIAIGDAIRVEVEDVSLLRRVTYGRRLAGAPEGRTSARKTLRRASTRPAQPDLLPRRSQRFAPGREPPPGLREGRGRSVAKASGPREAGPRGRLEDGLPESLPALLDELRRFPKPKAPKGPKKAAKAGSGEERGSAPKERARSTGSVEPTEERPFPFKKSKAKKTKPKAKKVKVAKSKKATSSRASRKKG